MGKTSRTKGAKGELQLAALLNERLGLSLTRRLAQYQSGGHDLDGWEGVHVESKRNRTATQGQITGWWHQTLEQCPGGETPVLAYRADRQDWRFVIRPSDWSGPTHEPIEVTIDGFVEWVRHGRQLKMEAL
ncbi:putative PDDEXK endonuclease [Modicisalibacter coralii]|uniref:putative PDDEXK endonuclease n=1 Tax=Modicisalibacter coralii TaxID=2304602 RepID=UPI00100BCC13|nr:hypothetical protein [Halomonas coralii]